MDVRWAAFMQAWRRPDRPWTSYTLRQLVEAVTDRPGLWFELATPSDGERSYELAFRDHEVEVWFISWPQDAGIEMHDHDQSCGALAVLDGSLMETRAAPGDVHRRARRWRLRVVPAGVHPRRQQPTARARRECARLLAADRADDLLRRRGQHPRAGTH